MMGEAIQQRRRELFVTGKDGHPLGKREISGDDRRAPLIAIRDQIEEQLAADAVKRDEAQLIDDEDVDPQEALM